MVSKPAMPRMPDGRIPQPNLVLIQSKMEKKVMANRPMIHPVMMPYFIAGFICALIFRSQISIKDNDNTTKSRVEKDGFAYLLILNRLYPTKYFFFLFSLI